MRHPPRGLLLAAVAGPVVLLGAGPAAADQTPADPTPTAGQTADATAGAAGTTGEPGTPGTTSASADSTSTSSSSSSGSSAGGSTAGPSGSGTPAPETAPNGLISACTGACLVTLDELLTHMFDVLHPAESPSATPADASSGGTPPADSTGSGSGSNSSGSAAGSDSPPGTGDTVTVTTSDGTKLTGTVTAVNVTKLTITLTAPDDTTTAPADDTAQVLSLLNAERAKVSCPALTEDSALTTAAQAHSVDMSTRKALTHTDASGADPFTRAQAAGVLTLRSENVADGQATPDEVVADWMQSAKHKANILDCGVSTAGIGVATSADGTRYWTADFGVAAPAAPAATPADASAPASDSTASDTAGGSASDTAAPTSSAPTSSAPASSTAGSTGGGAAPTD
jgi:uncharacterized protein YkwD